MVNQRLDEALAVIHRIYTKTVLPEGDCIDQAAVHAVALCMASAMPQAALVVTPRQGLKAAAPAHSRGSSAQRHCIHITWSFACELSGAKSHAGPARMCLHETRRHRVQDLLQEKPREQQSEVKS